MDGGLPTPVSLGFSEFIAKLISDTFDAVVFSMSEQEEKLSEITRIVSVPEEFAQTIITDDDVEGYLTSVFPGDESHPHLVYLGATYQPAMSDLGESPPFEKIFGIKLKVRNDYTKKPKEAVFSLTSYGVERIRSAVRVKLSADRLAALREMIRRGIPRLMVDAGHINAKLTFQVIQNESASDEKDLLSDAAKLSNVSSNVGDLSARLATPLQRYSGLTRPFATSGIRLNIRPIDSRDPQVGQIKVNVISEVEVTFKTIT